MGKPHLSSFMYNLRGDHQITKSLWSGLDQKWWPRICGFGECPLFLDSHVFWCVVLPGQLNFRPIAEQTVMREPPMRWLSLCFDIVWGQPTGHVQSYEFDVSNPRMWKGVGGAQCEKCWSYEWAKWAMENHVPLRSLSFSGALEMVFLFFSVCWIAIYCHGSLGDVDVGDPHWPTEAFMTIFAFSMGIPGCFLNNCSHLLESEPFSTNRMVPTGIHTDHEKQISKSASPKRVKISKCTCFQNSWQIVGTVGTGIGCPYLQNPQYPSFWLVSEIVSTCFC